MYASIPDALRALARKIGADANGRNEEEILNNIVVKLGGTPVTNHGVAGSIDAMTKVVDLDVMHNMTTLSVTPTTSPQSITPESPVDGYSSVSVSAVTSAIDQNIVAGNIKKDVEILGVTGSYEGSGAETFEVGFAINFPAQGSPTVTSTTKTYTELMTALNSGKNLVPVFDFTYPEGTVISSVTAGDGFINNSGNIVVECKMTAEVSGTVIDVYFTVIWNNPESFTDEFFVSFYNNQK